MDYNEFKESMIDYLSGNVSEEQSQNFEQFLANNPEHNEEFEATKMFWNGGEEKTPEPTSAMDVKFYTMLNNEAEIKEETSLIQKIENFLFGNLPKQLVYTLAILAIGFFVGTGFNFSDDPTIGDLETAQKETQEVRSQLVLTLLDQPSANKRLQAVNEVNKLNTVTEKIIKALFSTLNNDPNVNVRLSAIESLKNYTDMPIVREGLVGSIVHQKSPLVQVELADLMVVLQEKKAVKSFEKLIKEEDVNISAKQKMEQSIKEIY